MQPNGPFSRQRERILAQGLVAALDQSGGSTPKALRQYGIDSDQLQDAAQMFARIHQIRQRIILSPAFTAERVLAAILFEDTLHRQIRDLPSGQYLWQHRQIVPILKIDDGLAEAHGGMQLMKPLQRLPAKLNLARQQDVFGTKARSLVMSAEADIDTLVDQQFDYAGEVLNAGLIPILEPEVHIDSLDKAVAEARLLDSLLRQLDRLPSGSEVMLKLTLPEHAGFYRPLLEHPAVLRVLALSGGYSRAEACRRLQANPGVIPSFSRALLQDLHVSQNDAEFDQCLDNTLTDITQALYQPA